MRSLSKAMLIGHLTADVDLRQTKSGRKVASFSVATNRLTKDENGNKKELADFHRIIAWQGLAEICNKYLAKGVAVFIEGRLINRFFDDKEGRRTYRTEIVADELNILTSRKAKGGKQEIVIESLSTPETNAEIQEEEALVAA